MLSGCQRHTASCDQQEELCFLFKSLVCLEEDRLRLDIRQKFFTVTVVRHHHRLPREAVDTLSVGVVKARLDGALGSLVYWKVSLLMAGEGWNHMIFKVPFNPNV